jgi:hypothetical protein
MQGWSPDFIPKLTADAVDLGVIHKILRIPGPEAIRCSQDLAKKEGIFVGITSGATFAGALKICAEAPKGSTVLCMPPRSSTSRARPRARKCRRRGKSDWVFTPCKRLGRARPGHPRLEAR